MNVPARADVLGQAIPGADCRTQQSFPECRCARVTTCREREWRQQKKAKLAARTKLSFAQEEDEEEDTEQNGSAKVC